MIIKKSFFLQKINFLWKNEFSKGGILLTISTFIVNLINYVFNIFVGRTVGPSGYGEITAFSSYSYIIAIPIIVFSTLLLQKISSRKDQFTYTLALENFFISKLRKYFYLFIPFIFIVPFIPKITNLSVFSSYSLIPLFIMTFIGTFYLSSLQATRLFLSFSLIIIFTAIIKLFGPGVALYFKGGTNIIIFFVLISSFFATLEGYRQVHKRISYKIKPYLIPKNLRKIITNKNFIIMSLSILAINAFNNFDIIFVKKFFSATETGIYSSWSLFSKVIFFSIGPLLTISFIFFSSPETSKKHNKTLTISLFTLSIIGILSYVIYSFFGSLIIHFFFGNRFADIVPYLGKASIFGILFTGISFINGFFLAQKSLFSIISVSALPIYVFLLFNIQKSIEAVINLNILFTSLLLLIYIISYITRFLYLRRVSPTK